MLASHAMNKRSIAIPVNTSPVWVVHPTPKRVNPATGIRDCTNWDIHAENLNSRRNTLATKPTCIIRNQLQIQTGGSNL
jgi:hypothetical protein